jgi:hypothetical protein
MRLIQFPKRVAIKSGRRLVTAKIMVKIPRPKMRPSTGIIMRFETKNNPGN